MRKTVLLPIEVPDNNCCWNGRVPCEHFDNEGGHGTCELDIGEPVYLEASGIYAKPHECVLLKAQQMTAGGTMIYLNGIKLTLEEAKNMQANLSRQIEEAEHQPEFWEGQLVEVRDSDEEEWNLRRFSTLGGSIDTPYVVEEDLEHWSVCRPLRDPMILQFRPHTPGDPVPYEGEVRVILRGGTITCGSAESLDLGTFGDGSIVGWMPAGGW